MIRKAFLLSVLFLFAAVIITPSASAQKETNAYKEMATEIARLVNEHRKSMGLKPMQLSNVICKIAEEHSTNMGSQKVPFSHDGMDGRVARANKELKQNASSWAENIATGQRNAKDAVAKWLSSPGHRENIEGDYNQTGVGIAKGKDGSLYFTQIFIKKS